MKNTKTKQFPAGSVTFSLPASLGVSCRSFTLKPLSPAEEWKANRTATSDGTGITGLVIELVYASLVVDDKASWWEAIGPKGRQLVTNAYSHCFSPSDSENADLLRSAKVP